MVNEVRSQMIVQPTAARPSALVPEKLASAAAPRDAVSLGTAEPSATPSLAAGAASGAAAGSAAQPKHQAPDYAPGQLLVKFDRTASLTDVKRITADLGLQALRHFTIPAQMQRAFGGELYQLRLPDGVSVEEGIKQLSKRPGVAYAEPNYKVHIDDPLTSHDAAAVTSLVAKAESGLPNDLDSKLWGIRNKGQHGGTAGVDVGAVDAWKVTTGAPNGQGPLVCIIDTGLDYSHPDLAANVWTNPKEIPGDGIDNDGNGVIDDVHGANLNAHNGDPMDDNEHGTHCAGTIGAVGNNGQGIVGVGWNATVASAKFLDASGSGTYADAIDAVLYATAIGARVTSNSWGGGGFSQALYDAFKASPAMHICAAGNNGSDSELYPSYPAAFDLDNVVSVAAIDRNGHLADFSNYGETSVDLAAPGVDIYSTKPGGEFQTLSGTSMATPHVTGVAALVLSQYPTLTNEQLKARLLGSVVKEDELAGKMVSGGRVNAAAALEDDSTPPSMVADLAVAEATTSSVALTFKAPGDDGGTGRAVSYELRYARQPITDVASWDAATPVKDLPAPAEAGVAQRITVPLVPDGNSTTYHFALRAVDSTGNVSATATTSGATLPAKVVFSEDFEGSTTKWHSSGGWGPAQEDGHGTVYQDSPGTLYPINAHGWVASPWVDLAGVRNPRLVFDARVDTEAGADNARVQVSVDGKRWDNLETLTGTSPWATQVLDLSAYEGQRVRVRFVLVTDDLVCQDGVSVDNVRVMGDPA